MHAIIVDGRFLAFSVALLFLIWILCAVTNVTMARIITKLKSLRHAIWVALLDAVYQATCVIRVAKKKIAANMDANDRELLHNCAKKIRSLLDYIRRMLF